MEGGLNGKRFVAELHGRGLLPDDAADIVCQLSCIPRRAARLHAGKSCNVVAGDLVELAGLI
jgi:hypothetical protein